MQRMLSLLRSCVEDYQMIKDNDRIAVGVSGGKDSLTLLVVLAALRDFYPKRFELEALSVDMGFEGMDFSAVEALCAQLNVPFVRIPTQIGWIVFEGRREKNPCSMCAKMRRGALCRAMQERGLKKIALGHHYDDAVETFVMSLLYEGRLSCFQPVTYLDRMGITQIRPMLYLTEKQVANFAAKRELPVVHNPCPADKHTKREDAKQLVYELCGRYPGFKENVFRAMQRLPLPEWGVVSQKKLQRSQKQQPGQPEQPDEQAACGAQGQPETEPGACQICQQQAGEAQKTAQ